MKQAALLMAIVSFLIFALLGTVMNAFCCNIPAALTLGAITGHLAARFSGPATQSGAISSGWKSALLAGIGAVAGYFLHTLIISGLVGVGVASDASVSDPTLSAVTSALTLMCLGLFSCVLTFLFMGVGGMLGGWLYARDRIPVSANYRSAATVIDVTPSPVQPGPEPAVLSRPPVSLPTPDLSGGRFRRHTGRSACGVCMASQQPGEGYEIPSEIFYGSKQYQTWLLQSPLGQMVIPAAGGIEAYLQKASRRRGDAPVIACAECLHLFLEPAQTPASPDPASRSGAWSSDSMEVCAEPGESLRVDGESSATNSASDLTGGRYARLAHGGICDVCAASMAPGEGYRIPVETFYASGKYRRWLQESRLGQTAIPMAGGIDAYLEAARAQDRTEWSGVCGHCVGLFL
jgi:hypothetical protein